MIEKFLKSVLVRVPIVRRFLVKKKQVNYDSFIKLRNTQSRKSFWMFLRNDSFMEKEFLEKGLYGLWEKESLKIWAELCRNSEYILDIGANTGVYSLIAKSQNPAAQIFAVEPVDVNFEVLLRNINKNEFDIRAEKIALSSKNGVAKMFMLKDRLNYMTSVNDNRYEKHPEISKDHEIIEVEVPTKTYQYLTDKYNIRRLDLIKIDVEGHEVEVLRPMLEDIKKDRPTILIEVIGEESARVLSELFLELGYHFISIDEVNKSRVVEKLWDNDHHNFLICDEAVVENLRKRDLVV